jgi:hypothetical protein
MRLALALAFLTAAAALPARAESVHGPWPLSNEEKPVVSAGDLIPSVQTMYLQSLAATPGAVTRLGIPGKQETCHDCEVVANFTNKQIDNLPLPRDRALSATRYVPYVVDEAVGSARYRTVIAVNNYGASPVRVETLFVSAAGARRRRTTTVPAYDSSSLASAVPAGAHGRLEVTLPPATATGINARLVAYGRGGRPLSSAEEPVFTKAGLIPSGQTMYLQNLADTPGFVVRLGIVMADDRGSCTLTAYGDMASGAREIGSARATGVAAVSRLLAEPLQALHAASLGGAWFAVTCDTLAYAYAAVLVRDGSRTSFATPDVPREKEVVYADPNLTNEELDRIPTPRDPVAILRQAAPLSPPSPDGTPPP